MANGRKPRHTFPQPQPSQFAPADLFSRKPLPGGGQRCQNVGMSELEISVGELQGKKKAGESFLLIDVREPWEYDLCRIAGAKLIPMGTIPANLQQLDGDEQVICYCHHGQRSLEVAAWLRAQGVEQAQSLAGGIERWSLEIDPSVPRY